MNFYENKKIFVAGGSGFLGTNFILELLNRGAIVRTSTHKRNLQIKDDRIEVIDNINLENINDTLDVVEGCDYIINSAGNILHPSTCPTDFQVTLGHVNIVTNLLDACCRLNIKGFLEINSSTVYPHKNYAVPENEYWEGEPYISYFGYGWMRRYIEKVIEHASHLTDTHIGIVRGTAPFGPFDNFNLETCHVVPALIKRCLKGENPFVVWGSPDVTRDFMYVKDLVKGCLLVLEKGKSMRPYNVGSGVGVTIGDLVNAILKYTKKDVKVEWDNSKPTTIPYKVSSTERIINELNFMASHTFEQGIEKTIQWYKNQYGDSNE